jgi:hypothetical protein
MPKIRIPDPQTVEMEALDDAFYKWLEEADDLSEYEKHDLANQYADIDRSALVYTSDDIYDDYDPMTGAYGETCMAAMENNMGDRINQKRRFIHNLNEAWYS